MLDSKNQPVSTNSPIESSEPGGVPRWFWLVSAIAVLAVLGLGFLSLQRPDKKKDIEIKKTEINEKADPIKEGRAIFATNRDIDSCKKVLQLINQTPAQVMAAPQTEIPGLTAIDLEYIKSSSFPPADAWFWAEQYLLRGIVQGNDLAPQGAKQLSNTHLTDTWDWVMRSVRLSELAVDAPDLRGIASLLQVIRRGTATAEERGLIFLELLNQFKTTNGPTGCLVATQRSADDPLHLLVAWQLEPGSPIFLGEPRTGRILGKPGEPASLDELLKDAKWLNVFGSKGDSLSDFKLSLNGATFKVPISLAALSERQNRAQTTVFPPNDSPILFRDCQAIINRLKTALGNVGLSEPKVVLDQNYLLRLINFLPKNEGGRDSGINRQATDLALIPWDVIPIELVPQAVQSVANLVVKNPQPTYQGGTDLDTLPRNLVADRPDRPQRLGSAVPENLNLKFTLGIFGGVFLEWKSASNKGRDLLVRGDFNRIVPDLIQEKEDLERKVSGISGQSRQDLVVWLNEGVGGLARRRDASDPGETQEDQMIRQAAPLMVYLSDRVALARMPDVQLALAQARHEQAAILDRKTRTNKQSQQGQDRIRQWKAAALAWGILAKDQQGKQLGYYARLWQGIAFYQATDLDSAKQAWIAAGDGQTIFPEQLTAKWLADSLGK